MSAPWDKLYAAASEAEKRGDLDKASELRYIGDVLEQAAEKSATAAERRAGSNAFRSDAEEAALRAENQQSFFRGGDRGR